MQALYACLAAALLVLGAQPADAECASPSVTFSPATGGVVPRRATVYLFAPASWSSTDEVRTEGSLHVEGARFVARQIMTSPAYSVMQIELFATGEQVTMRWKNQSEAVYRVGAPSANVAQVTQVKRLEDHWTCSFQDTIDMQVTGNAIAYRMDWSDGTSTVLPSGAWFFGTPNDRPSSIQVGHLNCMDYNIDPKALATLRRFDLVALFSDGAEHTIGSAQAKLDGKYAVLPQELLPHGAPPEDAPPRRDVPTLKEMHIPRELFNPRELPAPLYWRALAAIAQHIPAWAAVGALGSLGAISAFALLRRRRDHVPRY